MARSQFPDKSSAYMYLISQGIEVRPSAKAVYVRRLANRIYREKQQAPQLTPKEARTLGRGKSSPIVYHPHQGHILEQYTHTKPRDMQDIKTLISVVRKKRTLTNRQSKKYLFVVHGVPTNLSPTTRDKDKQTQTYTAKIHLASLTKILKDAISPLDFANKVFEASGMSSTMNSVWLSVEEIGLVV